MDIVIRENGEEKLIDVRALIDEINKEIYPKLSKVTVLRVNHEATLTDKELAPLICEALQTVIAYESAPIE